MRWLAYAHPVLMVGVLVLGVLVLREGLGVRRRRIARRPTDSRRHRRLARIFVLLLLAGYASGLASMAWLRDATPGQSFHFPLVSAAALSALAAGGLGLVLERRVAPRARRIHALCGAGALLCALAAAVAGFAILP